MRLQKLALKNFKGTRKFDLVLDGSDASVFADNAVGKTTLVDSFMWVLFGKDSLGRADFEIKTLDENGQPLHNLDHEVELTLAMGDGDLTLRKVYAEKWTKKRGSAKAEFTGHTTDHYLDGVPVQKKEFDARVAEIAPEDIFRLLTDPSAFNNLHWQKRRELLLQVCGDVTDEEVIASNEELADLPGLLGKRSLEDQRKVIEARRREINQALQLLPVRIDEVTNGLPELPAGTRKDLEADLVTLREQQRELERERARVQAGGEVAEKRKRLTEIQGELKEVENAARGAIDTKIEDARQKRVADQYLHDNKVREVRRLEGELEDVEARIAKLDKQLTELRAEWKVIDVRTFEHSHDDENCPVCGQAIPAEQIQEAHEKALAEFNAKQSRDLEANKAAGVAKAGERKKLENQVEDLKTTIAEGTVEVETLTAKVEQASKEVERLQAAAPDVSENPNFKQLLEEQARVEAAIESLNAGNTEALANIDERGADVEREINQFTADLAKFEQQAKDEARIAELSKQEKDLTVEFEELERQLYLCDQFTRAKVGLLTDRINSKFELARFKLFDVQVNGGLAETCETTYEGVPFGSLNHGARVQVGLDIVRTLQAHFGLFPPVWVDGRESVTSLPEMSCQVISLIVSEPDKRLRVQLGAPKREEVAA